MITSDDIPIINDALAKGAEIMIKTTKDGVSIYIVEYKKVKSKSNNK